MNWKQIASDYPKSIKLMEQWGSYPGVLSRQKLRLLYDFFDEHKVFVSVSYDGDFLIEVRSVDEYAYEDYSVIGFLGHTGIATRREAEDVAFTQAFKLLEEKL